LSHLEVRLMCSLAVHHKCTLKGGDFKQAFYQSYPPPPMNNMSYTPPRDASSLHPILTSSSSALSMV
jgi:hypothetical protein